MAQPQRRDDDGFTMIEVVVAMAVFALLAGSVLTVLVSTLRLSGDTSRRSVAANLAAQQVEAIRTLRAVEIADGGSTTTQTVAGTTYTLAQTASYVTSGASTSICSSSGNALAYKLITVSVTWPGMSTTKPVRSDTLRALGVGTDGLDATRGIAALTIAGATGSPVSGVAVTLTPGGATSTTGGDGCAVFTGLDPATVYSASVDQVGYVGQSGTQGLTLSPISVSAAQVTRATLYDDTAQQAVVTFSPPAGYTPAAGLSLLLRSSSATQQVPVCGGGATTTCASSIPGTLRNLYPTTYDVWSGTCADARPSAPARLALAAGSGATGSVAVPLAGVAVTVGTAGGPPVTGSTVYAVHAPDSTGTAGSACLSGERLTLGTSSAPALQAALPYGTWTITTSPSVTVAGDPTVTLTSSSGTATVQVAG